jgi:uncharacterized phiE125 gp8 family phage protein
MMFHGADVLDLVRTTAPDTTPVDLPAAKRQVHAEDFDDDDQFLEDRIDTATGWLDGYKGVLGEALVTQTWTLYLPHFGHGARRCRAPWPLPEHGPIQLPLTPLQSVTSIQYVDPTGASQTLDSSLYQVIDGDIAEIWPPPGRCWPPVQWGNRRAVTIEFVCGYGDADAVPATYKAAILLIIGHLYENRNAVVGVENRDSSTEMPLGVRDLLAATGLPLIR